MANRRPPYNIPGQDPVEVDVGYVGDEPDAPQVPFPPGDEVSEDGNIVIPVPPVEPDEPSIPAPTTGDGRGSPTTATRTEELTTGHMQDVIEQEQTAFIESHQQQAQIQAQTEYNKMMSLHAGNIGMTRQDDTWYYSTEQQKQKFVNYSGYAQEEAKKEGQWFLHKKWTAYSEEAEPRWEQLSKNIFKKFYIQEYQKDITSGKHPGRSPAEFITANLDKAINKDLKSRIITSSFLTAALPGQFSNFYQGRLQKDIDVGFKALPQAKKEEYGHTFTDWESIPLEERKTYLGSESYFKGFTEKELKAMTTKYMQTEDWQTFSESQKGKKQIHAVALSEHEKTLKPLEISAVALLDYTKSGKLVARSRLTSTDYDAKLYSSLGLRTRLSYSFSEAAGYAAAFPITLTQMGVKFITKKDKPLILPDVAKILQETKITPTQGSLSGAASDFLSGKAFSEDSFIETSKKYPLETIAATGGEVLGFATGQMAISTAFPKIKGGVIGSTKKVMPYMYQKIPAAWTKAFPKLQPLDKYVYGKLPTYKNIVKVTGYDSFKRFPGQSAKLVPRTTTHPVFTTTGKLKSVLLEAKPTTILKFKPATVVKTQTWLSKHLQSFRSDWLLPSKQGLMTGYRTISKKPMAASRYDIFQLAKTGYKRFTGLEVAVGKSTPYMSSYELKGYGTPTTQEAGLLWKIQQSFKRAKGKTYIPKSEYDKLFRPDFKASSLSGYYRTGEGALKTRLGNRLFIGDTTDTIATQASKILKTSRTTNFKEFLKAKQSFDLARQTPKAPGYTLLKTDVLGITKRRFGVEYGGMPNFRQILKTPKYPKLPGMGKARSGWSGVSLSELEAMEHGIYDVSSHWAGVAPKAHYFPTTTSANILSGVGGSLGIGAGVLSTSLSKYDISSDLKPDIKLDFTSALKHRPLQTTMSALDIKTDLRKLLAQQPDIDTSFALSFMPIVKPKVKQDYMSIQKMKYDQLPMLSIRTMQPYKFKIPKALYWPGDEPSEKKKRKAYDFGKVDIGYRYRRWITPRWEQWFGG